MKFGKFSCRALSAALLANAAIFTFTGAVIDLVLGLDAVEHGEAEG